MFRRLVAALGAIVVLAVVAGAVYFIWFDRRTPEDPAMVRSGDGQDFAKIERGRYLTAAADCAACHDAPGGAPFSGGLPIETPFGVLLAPNITPDPETSIGAWSDAAFDAAVRQGRRRDGTLLYPAMPFPYYAKMSRDDVLAIRAYLDTLAPVRHAVRVNRLPFPFNVRATMRVWDALYFQPGEFAPDAAKSAAWNRGAFLVEGPGHCGACHTPKTWLGGDEKSETFHGYQIQGWFAPDITDDERRGLGGWSVDDIVAYLRSGHNRIAAATGPMAEEVALSSSRMSEADLVGIATYLKDLPAGTGAVAPLASNDPQMTAGAAIYRDVCSGCHAIDGKGVPELFPALASSSAVRSDDPASLIRVILRGARSVATSTEPTAPAMPAFGWQLDDDQLAAVATYIRNSWGSAAPAVSADTVHKTRAALAFRSD
jgi:mono/diheme cytochrome c family protein